MVVGRRSLAKAPNAGNDCEWPTANDERRLCASSLSLEIPKKSSCGSTPVRFCSSSVSRNSCVFRAREAKRAQICSSRRFSRKASGSSSTMGNSSSIASSNTAGALHWNQGTRSRTPRQLLQAQTFLSQPLAQRNFRQSGQSAQITYAPAFEGCEQTRRFFLLVFFSLSCALFTFPPLGKQNFHRQTIPETRLLSPAESRSRRKNRGPRARQRRDSKLRRHSHQVQDPRRGGKGRGQFRAACPKEIPYLRDLQVPCRLRHLPRTARKTARNPAERRAPRIPATVNADAASISEQSSA